MPAPQRYRMNFRRPIARGFTLVELLIVIAVLAILIAIVPFGLLAAREAARQNGCIANARQLGTAVAVFASASGRLPNSTLSEADYKTTVPGGDKHASYSWIVQLLPMLEESALNREIQAKSFKYTKPAFTKFEADATGLTRHPSTVFLPALRCPSFTGPEQLTDVAASDYSKEGVFAPGVGIGNYVAVVGTHMESTTGLTNPMENGVMVSKVSAPRGTKDSAIGDGTTKTILFMESRESNYGSWYDGQSAWVVTIDPNVKTLPAKLTKGEFAGYTAYDPPVKTALGIGPTKADEALAYLPAGRTAATKKRNWGPSSEHVGGVVITSFVDTSIKAIRADVDSTVLFFATTINGAEPVDRNAF